MDAPIVVGVDGSPTSLAALRWAARAATRYRRGLDLVHAFAWPAYAAAYGLPPAAWHDPDLLAAAKALLRRAATLAHVLASHVDVHGEVRSGMPAQVLTEASREASMVVLGTRGAGGFAGLLVGSVSTQVARHASSTVVVVPERIPPVSSPRVVVGTDGSPGADAALRFAFEEAAARHAVLVVIHAAPPPLSLSPSLASSSSLSPSSLSPDLVEGGVRPWREKYPTVPVDLRTVADHPARALTAAAEGATLLVVGAGGHGGFLGMHLGSVSVHVLHHTPCAVAIVRPSGPPPDQD
jgi:nucleotide-binding universal stress UspA family protein